MKPFLVDHGDLCMAKYTWPRDLTPDDEETNINDAVQLPVFERLGVVKSTSYRRPDGFTCPQRISSPPGAIR